MGKSKDHGPPAPDQHHIRYLEERLELVHQALQSISAEIRVPEPGMSEQEVKEIQRENDWAPKQLVIDVKSWFEKEFSTWAVKVVEAFGLDRFPTYCGEPELLAADEEDEALTRVITGTDQPGQAGLRMILWAAAREDPTLLVEVTEWYHAYNYQSTVDDWVSGWAHLLIEESDDGYRIDLEPMKWVRRREFSDLTKSAREQRDLGQPEMDTARQEAGEPSMLTPPKLAKRLGVSADKIRDWIRSGELAAFNRAKRPKGRPRYLISEEAIAEFEKKRLVEKPSASPRKRRKKDSGITEYFK